MSTSAVRMNASGRESRIENRRLTEVEPPAIGKSGTGGSDVGMLRSISHVGG